MNWYLDPKKNPSGAYGGVQSVKGEGFLAFPEELMAVFYPADKEGAGFVDIEHDGETVTACRWNEEAYQEWLAQRGEVSASAAEEDGAPLSDAQLAAAILSGVNDI